MQNKTKQNISPPTKHSAKLSISHHFDLLTEIKNLCSSGLPESHTAD